VYLKNYTSNVPVTTSINRIEHRLSTVGASPISKMYQEKHPVGMIFQLKINDMPMTFKLPAKIDAVFNVFWKEIRRPRPGTETNIRNQAERTAWKILSEWIDIQVSLIQLEQADAVEVFLSYSYDPKADKTLFEKVKEGSLKLLT